MGLDITAFRKLTPAPRAKVDSDGYPVNWQKYHRLNWNPDFPGRAGSIQSGAVYAAGETFGFRAGSYSGYNDWREWLARLAGYQAAHSANGKPHSQGAWESDEGPFWELINFSDCEGVIGPEASERIARDFAAWDDRAKAACPPDEPWFYDQYRNWRRAFEMAADHGAVNFH